MRELKDNKYSETKICAESRRPLVYIVVSLTLGILLFEKYIVSVNVLFALVCLSSLLAIIFIQRRVTCSILILMTVFCLGGYLCQSRNVVEKDHVLHVAKYYRKKPVLVEGVIVSDVEERSAFVGKKTSFVLDVVRLESPWGWRTKSGKLLVNIFRDVNLSYGDLVQIRGRMHYPFEFSEGGRFSYREYLKRKNINYILSVSRQGEVKVKLQNAGNRARMLSLKIKHRFKRILHENFTDNEASIMQAVLLGDRYNIPKHIKELFELSGLAHVFAISGLHMGIVAFLIFLLVKLFPFPRRMHYFLAIFFLIAYAFMIGGRPSVVRATIMASVFLMSFIIEREADTINTLCFSALIILLWNPLSVFDVGFQLSFISVFSIITFYPIFMSLFQKIFLKTNVGIVRYLMQSLSVSLSAYLGVAGLIAYCFQIITPVSIFANILVIPLISIVVAFGMGLLFAGIIFAPLAIAFSLCIKVMLNLMVAFIFLCTKIPGAYFKIDFVSGKIVFLYYLLIFITLGLINKRKSAS